MEKIPDTISNNTELMQFEKRTLFAAGCNAVIFNSKKWILLLIRSDHAIYRPNSWDLPGGKICDNESPEEAVIRETFEETGLRIKVLQPFECEIVNKPTCSNKVISIKLIATCDKTVIPLSSEHTHYRCVHPEKLPNDLELSIKKLIAKANRIISFH